MAEYKLYCFAQSGHSYKVALMLNLVGASWEPIFVDFFNGETRSDHFRSHVNEMGEAPVLAHEMKSLSQSGVILTYLAEKFGKFNGQSADERLEILRWILFDNHKLTSYLATYRFLRNYSKNADPAVLEFLKGRTANAFKVLEKHLQTTSFVNGAHLTIADLSLCGYLFYPSEELGFEISVEYPAVAGWLDRIRKLPGWVHPYELMPGHPMPKSPG
ncbi:MAG TPA: glutathione S-transferase [Xanthobacteraceae bacterium]|nr:glutathione S-transferase [Xanthobacteraceae bacterium]